MPQVSCDCACTDFVPKTLWKRSYVRMDKCTNVLVPVSVLVVSRQVNRLELVMRNEWRVLLMRKECSVFVMLKACGLCFVLRCW